MPDEVFGFLEDREPLPFEHLFVPVVLNARDRLRQQVDPSIHALLTPQAHFGWERYLLIRLTTAGAEIALWQFRIFKSAAMPFSGARAGKQGSGDTLYRSFVGRSPQDPLQKLFSQFPDIGSICDKLVTNWIATVIEFLGRLHGDHCRLTNQCRENGYHLPVTKSEAGLGDAHRDGRCVARLTFSDGTSLIYKPRSLAPEAHFSVLLFECNRLGIPHLLRAPEYWDRGEYGWMEDIKAATCESRDEVRAFYWRAGVLLGLVYLARGVDCHRGNLIAAGGFPVLVDLETLLHPPMPTDNQTDVALDSVLRTGFLPRGPHRPDALYQWSGLSRVEQSTRRAVTWIYVNQDAMAVVIQIRNSPTLANLPVLEKTFHLAPRYSDEVQSGFGFVGEMFLVNPERRAWFGRWLRELVDCPRRQVLRPTLVYQNALRWSTLPATLFQYESSVERLNTFPQKGREDFNAEEVESLIQFDIPYFSEGSHKDDEPDTPLAPPCSIRYFAQLAVIALSLGENDNALQNTFKAA